MNDYELIMERIYYYMREQNLSMHRLSVLSGLTQSTLSSSVSRKSIPKVETLLAVCKGLGISLHEFFDFPPYNEVEK